MSDYETREHEANVDRLSGPVPDAWEPPTMGRCECDARDPDATIYHGGNADGCPREAADHMNGWPGGVVSSPALCMVCLFGCADDDDETTPSPGDPS